MLIQIILILFLSIYCMTELTGKEKGDMTQKMDDVAAELFKEVEKGNISQICAGLLLQLEFIDVLTHGSDQIRLMTQQWTDSPQGNELKVHLDDFSGLLSRILEEALEISNPLLASHSTQVRGIRTSNIKNIWISITAPDEESRFVSSSVLYCIFGSIDNMSFIVHISNSGHLIAL